ALAVVARLPGAWLAAASLVGVGFFFQAEDGIRDDLVTGVQTCALPILSWISNLVSTVWTSGPAKSAIDIGRCTTIVVSGGIGMDISAPAYVAATLWGVNPAYSATIAAPNT